MKDPPSEIFQVDLKEPPEVINPVTELQEKPAVSEPVPMLPDNPVVDLRKDAFTEAIVPVPVNSDKLPKVSSIPMNPGHTPTATGLDGIIDHTLLDKQPEPVSRTSPTFPYELQKSVTEATVVVGFVISNRGEVVSPHIISSSHPGFERSALTAIQKWKFKPGVKDGKKVNTRVEQLLSFVLTDQN